MHEFILNDYNYLYTKKIVEKWSNFVQNVHYHSLTNQHITIKMNLIQTTLQSYGLDITKTKYHLTFAKFINDYYFGLPKVSLVIEAWSILVNVLLPSQEYVNMIHHKGVIQEHDYNDIPPLPPSTKKHK